jgi:translation initiation factor 2B subunit (eIF-2B alpha/beta/delta family)
MLSKKKRFGQIVQDIKKIKIQGASGIAKAALKAYSLFPGKNSKNILLKSRPTEPMMAKILGMAEKTEYNKILKHFSYSQDKINSLVLRLIWKDSVIFTHCHSTNVSKALIYAHKKGKKFEVYSTETRPLYQGRKTAMELRKSGIKVTSFVDSSIGIALSKKQGFKKVNHVLIGADALLKNGIINKVGSELVARIAHEEKTPFFIVADSWKFTKDKVPIEQRNLNEVWNKAPKNIKIRNPAFEFVSKNYITGIITELGFMKYDEFIRRMNKA